MTTTAHEDQFSPEPPVEQPPVVGAMTENVPERQAAPESSLPSWDECKLRVDNSDYVSKRESEGGYGLDTDTLAASALHQFIYEYDDADGYRSAWFRHRLDRVLKEAHAPIPRDPVGDLARQDAEINDLRVELVAAQANVSHLSGLADLWLALRNVPDSKLGEEGIPCIALPIGTKSGKYLNGDDADAAIRALLNGEAT